MELGRLWSFSGFGISEITRDHFWDPVSASLIYVPSTRISDFEKTTAFL